MAVDDLLSQDEIDALLHGVDSGEIETESADSVSRNVEPYDFSSQDRVVRGRLPTLEIINERFARLFRISLFSMLRRSLKMDVGSIETIKFSEYVGKLAVPASLNLVRIKPLRGMSLFVIDPKLVFVIVDSFFGGDGKHAGDFEGHEFTPTELRVVQLVLEKAFESLAEAWTPVQSLDFEYVGAEINPQFANIVSPAEIVVCSTFHIELDGNGGDFHITLPYSMIEPIRNRLGAGIQSDGSEADERWSSAFREEMKAATVDLDAEFTDTQISLRDVLNLKTGDVIPIDIPELITLRAEGLPLFKAEFGVSSGMNALKIVEVIKRQNYLH